MENTRLVTRGRNIITGITPNLRYGDIVVFTLHNGDKLYYHVVSNHLSLRCNMCSISEGNLLLSNDAIFNYLISIGRIRDKLILCSQQYSYKVGNENWPEARYDDYDALRRLVNEIYRLLDFKFENIKVI